MTARAGGFAEAQVPDIERRLASVVRLGTVAELDEAKARIRVKAGQVTTGWLPWTVGRAGPDRHWTAPEIGEQVIMVAPSGDLAQAVVVGSIYQQAHPAPANSKDKSATEWSDGARLEYDRASHTHSLTVPDGGLIVMTIGGTTFELRGDSARVVSQHVTIDSPTTDITGDVAITGDVTVGGGVTAQGDVIGEEVSLAHHLNTNVTPGPGLTGPPQKG
jgi:phage baseplate assembly protein V